MPKNRPNFNFFCGCHFFGRATAKKNSTHKNTFNFMTKIKYQNLAWLVVGTFVGKKKTNMPIGRTVEREQRRRVHLIMACWEEGKKKVVEQISK
jgi:hypothetical protein